MTFLTELKRRNVFRVAAFYVVSGWLILQAGDVLFGLLEVPAWGLRLVLGILVLGFPIALVFSWVFELTPEGLKLEKDIDRSRSVTPQTGRKLDVAIVVSLLLVAVLVLWQQLAPSPVRSPTNVSAVAEGPRLEQVAAPAASPPAVNSDNSVAVLAFTNMSPDPNHEYFADGLSDTLIHVLAQVSGLRVTAKTSSFFFKGKDVTIAEIADRLEVAHVLEGSVQRSGNRIRVIAQLISSADGSHVWSGNFDRELEDMFAVQDEIAGEVVDALKVALMDDEQERLSDRYQPSVEAYSAWVLGRREMAKRTAEGLAAAEVHFKRAIEADPDYALAYVGLADTYQLQVGYAGFPMATSLELREALAAIAIELAPHSGEALKTRATIHHHRRDFDAAEIDYLAAIELSPNDAQIRNSYQILLANQGRLEESLAQLQIAAQLDPMSDIVQANIIAKIRDSGNAKEAIARLRQNIERNPDFPSFYSNMASTLAELGRIGEAQRWWEEALERNPGNVGTWIEYCTGFLTLLAVQESRTCSRRFELIHPESTNINHVALLFFEQDWQALIQYFRAAIEREPAIRFNYAALSVVLAREGDLHGARELILDAYPELFEKDAVVHQGNRHTVPLLAAILDGMGEVEQRDVLLQRTEAYLGTLNPLRGGDHLIIDVWIHAIRGDNELAIAALRNAIDRGWRYDWVARTSLWFLDELWEDPRYVAIVGELEADAIAQHQWYEANKDVPIEDVLASMDPM